MKSGRAGPRRETHLPRASGPCASLGRSTAKAGCRGPQERLAAQDRRCRAVQAKERTEARWQWGARSGSGNNGPMARTTATRRHSVPTQTAAAPASPFQRSSWASRARCPLPAPCLSRRHCPAQVCLSVWNPVGPGCFRSFSHRFSELRAPRWHFHPPKGPGAPAPPTALRARGRENTRGSRKIRAATLRPGVCGAPLPRPLARLAPHLPRGPVPRGKQRPRGAGTPCPQPLVPRTLPSLESRALGAKLGQAALPRHCLSGHLHEALSSRCPRVPESLWAGAPGPLGAEGHISAPEVLVVPRGVRALVGFSEGQSFPRGRSSRHRGAPGPRGAAWSTRTSALALGAPRLQVPRSASHPPGDGPLPEAPTREPHSRQRGRRHPTAASWGG